MGRGRIDGGTRRPVAAIGMWLLVNALGPGCGGDPPDPTARPKAARTLLERFEKAVPAESVRVLDPEQATPGFTLALFDRRLPFLMDRAGRVVHAWPDVRATGRARLTPDGNLLVIAVDGSVEQYDWEGRRIFRFELPERHIPHHDVIVLRNGNLLVLARPVAKKLDYLLEVDPEGEVVWRWELFEHRARFAGWDGEAGDPGHINSLHELGPNRAFDEGDTRFRPGNLLISARNLDTIFIIDRETSEVVWQRTEGLDRQHEAIMIPKGEPGAGEILVFNNGKRDKFEYRRSRLQRFDPRTGATTFDYSSPRFFTSSGGIAQPLPNGNLFVTSSQGGRVFELTPQREIVWQYEPRVQPMRAVHYPLDHCPQLADIRVEPPRAIVRGTPFVDRDLYTFSIHGTQDREVAGFKRPALRKNQVCRRLRIPVAARLHLEYGLDREQLGDGWIDMRFLAEIQEWGSEERVPILDDRIEPGDSAPIRRKRISLEAYADREVTLCLDAQPLDRARGVRPKHVGVWSEPRIQTKAVPEELPVSAEEQRLREAQLRAIGYAQ